MSEFLRCSLPRLLYGISVKILVDDLIKVLLGIELVDILNLVLRILKDLLEINLYYFRLDSILLRINQRLFDLKLFLERRKWETCLLKS